MAGQQHTYRLEGRIWITGNNGHFAGAGRVRLLELIHSLGSISAAAREMKMSYRQAWQMVQDMNARSAEPLVDKVMGGKGGGGARITDAGERLIKAYHHAEDQVAVLLGELTDKLKL